MPRWTEVHIRNGESFLTGYLRWKCDNNKECLRCINRTNKGIVRHGWFEECLRSYKKRQQHKKLHPRGAKQKVKAKPLKGCGLGKVRNKLTNRCINKNGATAKALNKKTCNSTKVCRKRTRFARAPQSRQSL